MDETPKKSPSVKENAPLVLSLRPALRARIKALAEHEQRSVPKIIESAINLYFDQKSTRDRHIVNTLSKQPDSKQP